MTVGEKASFEEDRKSAGPALPLVAAVIVIVLSLVAMAL